MRSSNSAPGISTPSSEPGRGWLSYKELKTQTFQPSHSARWVEERLAFCSVKPIRASQCRNRQRTPSVLLGARQHEQIHFARRQHSTTTETRSQVGRRRLFALPRSKSLRVVSFLLITPSLLHIHPIPLPWWRNAYGSDRRDAVHQS